MDPACLNILSKQPHHMQSSYATTNCQQACVRCFAFCFAQLVLARSTVLTKAAWQDTATIIPHTLIPPAASKSPNYTHNKLNSDYNVDKNKTKNMWQFSQKSREPPPVCDKKWFSDCIQVAQFHSRCFGWLFCF